MIVLKTIAPELFLLFAFAVFSFVGPERLKKGIGWGVGKVKKLRKVPSDKEKSTAALQKDETLE